MKLKKTNLIFIAVISLLTIAVIILSVLLCVKSEHEETATETVRKYAYSSEKMMIELILTGGKVGTYSLELANTTTQDIYTGRYWSDSTSQNGWEKLNIKGYEPAYLYVFYNDTLARVPYKQANKLVIKYTLELQSKMPIAGS